MTGLVFMAAFGLAAVWGVRTLLGIGH